MLKTIRNMITNIIQISIYRNKLLLITSIIISASLILKTLSMDVILDSFDGNTEVRTAVGSGFYADSDGYGVLAGLNTPYAVALDTREQYLYTTDYGGGGEVRRITITTGYTKTIGIGFYWKSPQGIAVDSSNNIYVADLHRVNRMPSSDPLLRTAVTIAGKIDTAGFRNGNTSESTFSNPFGIVINEVHECVFVADRDNDKIRKIDISSSTSDYMVTTLVEYIGKPYGIALSSSRTLLFISSVSKNSIYKYDFTQDVLALVAGSGSEAIAGSSDGTFLTARFTNPSGISVDSLDNIYVTDLSYTAYGSSTSTAYYMGDMNVHSVRVLYSRHSNVSTLAGKVPCITTTFGTLDTQYNTGCFANGRGADSSFYYPKGISVNKAGSQIFVADTGNNRLRQIGCLPGFNMTYGVCFMPTALPTGMPSMQPSGQPSVEPSQQPFSQPSAVPTVQPSVEPSLEPTSQPSVVPSVQPSVVPSNLPTVIPSVQPFINPSSQPSVTPSSEPSGQPSVKPSYPPSNMPTVQPVSLPTVLPSFHPSMQPSPTPSMQPSVQPSPDPTLQPSSEPSVQPSVQPSLDPTMQPTSLPSVQPAVNPTGEPSQQPSGQPSLDPTVQPSGQPSIQPSVEPSLEPTNQPSVKPSLQPAPTPTSQPSLKPSSTPTYLPSTQRPTFPPSTSQPSTLNRAKMTFEPTSHPSPAPSPFTPITPASYNIANCSTLNVGTLSGTGCPLSCDNNIDNENNNNNINMASFNAPKGIAVSPSDEYLLVTDGNALRIVDILTGYTQTIVKNYEWFTPTAVAIDSKSVAYIVDKHRLSMVNSTEIRINGTATLLAGSTSPGNEDMECLPINNPRAKQTAKSKIPENNENNNNNNCVFNNPTGVAIDEINNVIYIADNGNNAIRKVSLLLLTYANSNAKAKAKKSVVEINSNVMTIAQSPMLNNPYDIAIDTFHQVLYITSYSGNSIFKLSLNNVPSFPILITSNHIFAGSIQGVGGFVDGLLKNALFIHPTGITLDEISQILYLNQDATDITTRRNRRQLHSHSSSKISPTSTLPSSFADSVRKITLSNGHVSTIAGGGLVSSLDSSSSSWSNDIEDLISGSTANGRSKTSSSSSSSNTIISSSKSSPLDGVNVDADVDDSILLLSCSMCSSYINNNNFANGYSSNAIFSHPIGIALSNNINISTSSLTLFVADSDNNRIRNISCNSNNYTTFAPTNPPINIDININTIAPSLTPTIYVNTRKNKIIIKPPKEVINIIMTKPPSKTMKNSISSSSIFNNDNNNNKSRYLNLFEALLVIVIPLTLAVLGLYMYYYRLHYATVIVTGIRKYFNMYGNSSEGSNSGSSEGSSCSSMVNAMSSPGSLESQVHKSRRGIMRTVIIPPIPGSPGRDIFEG